MGCEGTLRCSQGSDLQLGALSTVRKQAGRAGHQEATHLGHTHLGGRTAGGAGGEDERRRTCSSSPTPGYSRFLTPKTKHLLCIACHRARPPAGLLVSVPALPTSEVPVPPFLEFKFLVNCHSDLAPDTPGAVNVHTDNPAGTLASQFRDLDRSLSLAWSYPIGPCHDRSL